MTINKDELVRVALGELSADLVLKNGTLVNVNSGEVHPADVAIKGDRIAAIGNVDYTIGQDTHIVDAQGAYLCPGLIDTHMHMGGSQLSMTEYARAVLTRGTTTISTDFYEIGIVAGPKAIRFSIDEMKRTPLKVLFTIPPHHYLGHGPFGNTNTIKAEDVCEMLDWPECIGLAEWNVGLWNLPIPEIREITELAWRKNKMVGGHYGQCPTNTSNATAALGIYSEHETGGAQEALDRIRLGIHVQVREGSAAHDLENVVKAITELRADSRHFSFCTDEQEADKLALEGHVDHSVRMAIANGVPPIVAVQMASLNAAEYFGVDENCGSIAPGKIADIVMVGDLAKFNVVKVIADGQVVAVDGRYVGKLEAPKYPDYFYNTIKLKERPSPSDFRVATSISMDRVRARVIGVNRGSLVTENRELSLPVKGGLVLSDPQQDVLKIVVFDRHDASGRMGKGFVQGLGIKDGAIGTSFNPGLMNLMVAGTNDEDMSLVANRIADLGGGYVVAQRGEILAELPMPLLGLFSDEPFDNAVAKLVKIDKAIRERLGSEFPGIHTAAAFICLAVSIPSLKICEMGLVDLVSMAVVDICIEEGSK